MFYLTSPSEANYQHADQVPDYLVSSGNYFIGMIAVEYIICILCRVKPARAADAFSSITAGISQQLPRLLFSSLSLPIYFWLYENYRLFTLPWDSPFTWYVSFILIDLAYYLFHRYSHEAAILWGAHQVHHSSEDYNLTTAIRQSIFQTYFSDYLYLPISFVLPPSHFLIHRQLNTIYQFWIHTECIETLGPLEHILNTPSHHRVHHGRNRYCIDKNYAGVLIIFDKMFGTFEAERKEDPVVYGLVHPLASWNPVWTQVCVYVELFKRFRVTEGFRNKLSVLFKGPGWTEGSPRLGDPSGLPDVHAPQPRYDSNISNSVSGYGLLHFIMMVFSFNILVRNKRYLPAFYLYSSVLFLIFSFISLGFIFEDRWHAAYFELLRLGFVFVCSLVGEYFAMIEIGFGTLVRGVVVVSIGFWVREYFNKKKIKVE